MNDDLKNIANMAANTSQDEPVLILDKPAVKEVIDVAKVESQPVTPITIDPSAFVSTPPSVTIDINDIASTIKENDVAKIKDNIPEYITRRREVLVMAGGMDPVAAEAKAIADIETYIRMNSTTTEEAPISTPDTKPQPEDIANIVIDKTSNVNNLGLTSDEHDKLEKVKRIRLVTVEDVELSKLVIERPEENIKMDYIKSIENSLSRYIIPLPILGDYVAFKGAQIHQMMNLIKDEDAKIEEMITAKASLVYEKFLRGTVMRKFDDNSKINMTYTEFVNMMPFQDLDMAVYGVICASSSNEAKAEVKCDSCKRDFTQTYNIRGLLSMENAPDTFKERVDTILKYSHDTTRLTELRDELRKIKRYKSPFSSCIFDLSYPTVARANAIFRRIDQTDPSMIYIAGIALYVSSILLYNESKGSYIQIDADRPEMLINTIMDLTQEDIQLISKQVEDELMYEPKFIFKTECPYCKHTTTNNIKIEHVVFLKAQDSRMEIDK